MYSIHGKPACMKRERERWQIADTHEDILELDVSVDEALAVQETDALHHVHGYLQSGHTHGTHTQSNSQHWTHTQHTHTE